MAVRCHRLPDKMVRQRRQRLRQGQKESVKFYTQTDELFTACLLADFGKNERRMTTRVFIVAGLSGVLLIAAACPKTGPQGGDLDRKLIALEALSRLKGTDLNSNPSLKAAALKVLEWTRGTPDFVTIVRDFHIPGQN